MELLLISVVYVLGYKKWAILLTIALTMDTSTTGAVYTHVMKLAMYHIAS